MKKITLAIFALIASAATVYGQATSTVQAPPSSNASTQNRAPNGNAVHKFLRGCFVIPQADCQALNLTSGSITNWGLKLLQGTSAQAVTGSFTLYIDNTSDATYTKGTNWATAIAGMPVHYQGNITVPVAAGGTVISVPLSSNFTYTGNGIYVAYEWSSNGPYDASAATYEANHLMTIGGATAESSVTPAPTTLANTNFRPVFLWTAANTATNEVVVNKMSALGTVAKLFASPHLVTAEIRNSSNIALPTITVGLGVTGANTFADVQTVVNLAAGATTVVTFAPFNPTASGLNNMTVTTGPDQVLTNNLATWSQTVVCDVQASSPPTGAYTNGVGFPSATGCILSRFKVPVGANLSGVRVSISSDAGSVGKTVCGAILDAAGTLLAYSTNTITISAAMSGTFQKFDFAPTVALTAGTDYHTGLVQLASGYYPIGYLASATPVTGYFRTPLAGGAPIAVSYGYFGIEPVFSFTNTEISASASKTVVCKKDGPNTVTLTATGLTTYTWVPGGSGASIVVSPTVASATGGNVVYVVSGTDGATGCKSANASIIVNVSACTALSSNSSNGYDLKLFPNPAVSGKSTITGLVGTNVVTVYNTLGQIVLTRNVSDESMNLDLSNQPSGNYLVKITNSVSESRTIKVVNQN